MKRNVALCSVVLAMVAIAACAPKATLDDCTAVCKKKAVLEATAAPDAAIEDPIAVIEKDFQGRAQELENQKAEAIQTIDQELQEKLVAAKDDQERETLTQEYATKKEEKAKEFQPMVDALNQQKADSIKAAQEKIAQAEEQKKAQEAAAVKTCADACVKAGTTKAKATCQMNAATIQDFGNCR